MGDVTFMGCTADPDKLRSLAADLDAGADDALGRVLVLPAYVLTAETVGSGRSVIAERLRAVAGFLERRRDGIPFGGPEFAASIARLKAHNERMQRLHPEWFTWRGGRYRR